MKMLITIAGVIAGLCMTGCGNRPIDESKLLGAWEIDAPTPKSVVFTFREDHTYGNLRKLHFGVGLLAMVQFLVWLVSRRLRLLVFF